MVSVKVAHPIYIAAPPSHIGAVATILSLQSLFPELIESLPAFALIGGSALHKDALASGAIACTDDNIVELDGHGGRL